MKSIYRLIFILLTSIMLAACGGGSSNESGSGNNNSNSSPSSADITAANVESFSKAMITAVNEVSDLGGNVSPKALRKQLDFAKSLSQKVTVACSVSGTFDLTTIDNVTTYTFDNCDNGDEIQDGTWTLTTSADGLSTTWVYDLTTTEGLDVTVEVGSWTITTSADGNTTTYVYDLTETFNGVAEITMGNWSFSTSADGLTTTWVYDFTSTIDGVTETYATTQVCVTDASTAVVTCTFESDDYEIDGQTYSYTQTGPATGNGTTGYTCPLDVESEDDGVVSIIARDIVTCDNGYIQSGSIDILDTDDNVIATIDFIDCTQFSITFDGSTTVYQYAAFF